jgi:pyruvate dehydrogenase E1 component beta subunit
MRTITYAQAALEAMMEEMTRDGKVIFMGEDVGKMGGCFGQHFGLLQEFGQDRVLDLPICESGYINFANGAAMAGMRPVAEIQFGDFMGLAFDAFGNQAPKFRYMTGGMWSVPVVVRTLQGGYLGAACQHSQCVESWFLNLPGLKIAVPTTPYDVKGLLKAAIRDDDPVLFLEHKALIQMKGEVPEEEYLIPLGQAKVVKEGKDVTVIAMQSLVYQSLDAAAELEQQGISIEIIDPRTVIPLDMDTIMKSVKKTGRVIVAHEAPKRGGVGAEISAAILERGFDDLKAPIKRIGALNMPIPFGPPEQYCLPNKSQIIAAAKELLNI